jgi:fermentation-respiration switch protein FrsA (DUF1100 family)
VRINLVRRLVQFLVTVAAFYGLLVIAVYFYQPRLIYFPDVPGRQLDATPEAIGLAFEDVRFKADGIVLHGWFIPATDDAPVVLYCHGNAGNISHRLERLELLHRLGLSVLLFDYRGYGQSEGTPTEQGTYYDASGAWAYLTQTRRIPASRIVIFGESLGGAIAARLASEEQPGALILSSTFTSATDLAAPIYWWLPVRLLSRFKYPTAEYVDRVHAPVLIMHGRDDEIIPYSHGEALFRRAHEPKAFLELLGGHNAGLSMTGAPLANGMRAFLEASGLI